MPKRSRRRSWRPLAVLATLGLVVPATPAAAAEIVRAFEPPRFSTIDHGGIELVGNTLMSCQLAAPGCAAARAGTATGADSNNNAYAMVFVDVDGNPATTNSSSAALAIPAGSTVMFAGLYWSGTKAASGFDQAVLTVPGGAQQVVAADLVDSGLGTTLRFSAFADVTAEVGALPNASGTYTVGGIGLRTGTGLYAGWTLAVAYRDPAAPLRSLTIFDGAVSPDQSQPRSISGSVSGFVTPATGAVTAQVGIAGGEGDAGQAGDGISLDGVTLSDAQNPDGNAWNSTIARLGTRVTAKNPDYANQLGYDVDLFDATGVLPNGASSATVEFFWSLDLYIPQVMTLAVDVFQPQLDVEKSVEVPPGVLDPGDTLDWVLRVRNNGNDPGVQTVLQDRFPPFVTIQSVTIESGANAGAKTLVPGDDQAEVVIPAFGPRMVNVRLGTGADAALGGRLDPGDTATIRIRARINDDIPAGQPLNNFAFINSVGLTLGTAVAEISHPPGGADGPTAVVVNSAPALVEDLDTTLQDTPITIDVLANDADVDGNLDATTLAVVADPASGAAVVQPDGSVLYTPVASFTGIVTFTYEVCDTSEVCSTAVATVVVVDVPDPPVARPDSYVIAEDTPITLNARANDSDPDGDIATARLVEEPTLGKVTGGLGTAVYTPFVDVYGTDTFVYEICDATNLCSQARVTIVIVPVPDPPVARDEEVSTPEDTPVVIDILANDTDAEDDLDPTSVDLFGLLGPFFGTATVDPATGVVTYTPGPDFDGDDYFLYTVCDLAFNCADAVAIIDITPVPDPPIGVDDFVDTDEDTPVMVDVVANDADPDGDLDGTSVTVTAPPSIGQAVVNPDGTITYTPDLDANGTDTFTYEICDAGGRCTPATVTLDVAGEPDVPVAVDDAASTDEDVPVPIDVLGNDTDADGDLDRSTVTITVPPATGSAAVAADGSITYTPAPQQSGTVTFSYQACDATALCATAVVTVTVDAVPDPPIARDDTASTGEDVPVTVAVLDNDADLDDDLDPSSVTVTTPAPQGTAVVEPTGAITFTPPTGAAETFALDYRVCDATGLCATATLTITIVAVPDAPVAADDAATLPEDGSATVDVTGNDTDADGDLDPGSVTVISGPTTGTAAVDPVTGAITYTPDADANGADQLTYQVCDAGSPVQCATAVLRLTVTPVPDGVIAVDDTATTDEDTPVVVDVSADDRDPDGDLDPESVEIVRQPDHGSAHVGSPVTYTPAPDFNGTDTFDYRVCDATERCDTATVTVTVTAVNDPPQPASDVVTLGPGRVATVDVAANDMDPDGIADLDRSSVTIVSGPAKGTASVDSVTGMIRYSAAASASGNDELTYRICDAAGACALATLTVVIGLPPTSSLQTPFGPVPLPPVSPATGIPLLLAVAAAAGLLAGGWRARSRRHRT